MSLFPIPLNVPYSNNHERELLVRMQKMQLQTQYYNHILPCAKCLHVIPQEKLKESVEKRRKESAAMGKDNFDADEDLIRHLLSWFKKDFFSWFKPTVCCGKKMHFIGRTQNLSAEERKGRASDCEVYQCAFCQRLERFPRYNCVEKLLQTRTGRCGEWAQVMTCMVRSLGYEARYVAAMFTDHVWTEYFSKTKKKWIHLDSCENSYNNPLLYENGWSKKFVLVLGFSHEEIVDCTMRYSHRMKEVLQRRAGRFSEVGLHNLLKYCNAYVQKNLRRGRAQTLHERCIQEKKDMLEAAIAKKQVNSESFIGRQSGSEEWRNARKESLNLPNFQEELRCFDSVNSKLALICLKDAEVVENNRLRLTKNIQSQVGAGWIPTPFPMEKLERFKVSFTFQIVGKNGADGFALVIHSYNDKKPYECGESGGGKGYRGIPKAIAISFDTYGGNCVSLQVCQDGKLSTDPFYSLSSTTSPVKMDDGKMHKVEVILNEGVAYILMNEKVILQLPLDLKKHFAKEEKLLVGFTGATGGLCQQIEVFDICCCSLK